MKDSSIGYRIVGISGVLNCTNPKKPYGFAVIFLALAFIFIPRLASAQSGTVTGTVIDAETSEFLAGVKIAIEESGQSISTDNDGRYTLSRISSGNHTLTVELNGYNNKKVSVSVGNGEQVVQNVELAGSFVEGDKIFEIANNRGQALALNRQRQTINNKSSITSEQMDRFGDRSIQDALARITGVQVGNHGEINIRGVGRDAHYVTLNGQRMGTTGKGDRSFDLNSISTDMIQELEIIKVITPDMDADALSGSININTRRPIGHERELNARFGGVLNTGLMEHTNSGSRASVNYADSPRDDLSITVNLDHQVDNRGWESLALNNEIVEFETGPADVVQSISPSMNIDERTRLGGGIELNFKPSDRVNYYIQGMVNNNDRTTNQHQNSWSVDGNWLDESTPDDGDGTFGYDLLRQDIQIRQYTFNTGARFLLDYFNLEYNLGVSSSDVAQQQYNLPFNTGFLDFSLNNENRTRPEFQAVDYSPKAEDMMIGTMNRVLNNHNDTKYTGRIDLEAPYSMGSVKFGTSALLTYKDGKYSNANFNNFGPLFMSNFDLRSGGAFNVMGQYEFPWVLDSYKAKGFLINNIPAFRKSEHLKHERSDIWNYHASEHIYAGYGMKILEVGKFTFLAGARMEYTDAEYSGRRVLFNTRGRYEETIDTSQTNSYAEFFPHAQIAFNPDENANIRLAYSKTIARPDFNLMAPFELVNSQDTTLFRGNPHLAPMTSNNFDVQFEYYFSEVGHLELGLFYKELAGFTVESQRTIELQDGDIGGFEDLFDEETTVVPVHEISFQNSDETANVYGLEVSWQQNLNFLPGVFSNLSTYANYTYSNSIYNLDSRDVALPAQSPHVVNAALQYSQGRFSGQVAYHWTAPSITGIQRNRSLAPLIDPTEQVYMDRYEDGWTDVSLSLRYRLTDNFRIWADAFNLLNAERVHYDNNRDLYPRIIDFREGYVFNVGIRYNL